MQWNILMGKQVSAFQLVGFSLFEFWLTYVIFQEYILIPGAYS